MKAVILRRKLHRNGKLINYSSINRSCLTIYKKDKNLAEIFATTLVLTAFFIYQSFK